MQCWIRAVPDSLSVGLLVGRGCVLLLKATSPLWALLL